MFDFKYNSNTITILHACCSLQNSYTQAYNTSVEEFLDWILICLLLACPANWQTGLCFLFVFCFWLSVWRFHWLVSFYVVILLLIYFSEGFFRAGSQTYSEPTGCYGNNTPGQQEGLRRSSNQSESQSLVCVMLCISGVTVVKKCPSVCLSVCLYVPHYPVLCQNG